LTAVKSIIWGKFCLLVEAYFSTNRSNQLSELTSLNPRIVRTTTRVYPPAFPNLPNDSCWLATNDGVGRDDHVSRDDSVREDLDVLVDKTEGLQHAALADMDVRRDADGRDLAVGT
jgi:hypothetical protein